MKNSGRSRASYRNLVPAAIILLAVPFLLHAQSDPDEDLRSPDFEWTLPDSASGEFFRFRMHLDSGRFFRLPETEQGRRTWIFSDVVSATDNPYPCSFLGIYGDDGGSSVEHSLNDRDERQGGAFVRQVIEGTGAERAGLEESDRIVRFDGKEVSGMMTLRRMVLATEPGTNVSLTVVRDGETRTIIAEIGSRNPDRPCEQSFSAPHPELNRLRERMDSLRERMTRFRYLEAPEVPVFRFPDSILHFADSVRIPVAGLRNRIELELKSLDSCRISGSLSRGGDSVFTRLFRRFDLSDRDRLGISVQSIPDQLREYFEVPGGEKGILVTEVGDGTRAEISGFRAGDIIIEVNGKKISTPVDLLRARSVESAAETFVIIRDGKILQLRVEPNSASEESGPSESLR